LNQQAHF